MLRLYSGSIIRSVTQTCIVLYFCPFTVAFIYTHTCTTEGAVRERAACPRGRAARVRTAVCRVL